VIVQACRVGALKLQPFSRAALAPSLLPDPLAVQTPAPTGLLIGLNLALQLFDGVATYAGWQQFGEANPLLRAGFEMWGAGPTLLAAKLLAILLLLLLARVPRRALVGVGLVFTLGAYAALSFIPWSLRLLI